jgi:hypothetical protein
MLVATFQALLNLSFAVYENEDRAQGENSIISPIYRVVSHVPFMNLESGRSLANNVNHHLTDLQSLHVKSSLMQWHGKKPRPDP